MKQLRIQNRIVGPGQPVFVIAEIGVNHDGDLNCAKQLVGLAKRVGADAVKLQLFAADRLMHRESAFAEYQSQRVDHASPADMLRQYELHPVEVTSLVEEIRAAGMIPLATPFSAADIELVSALQLPAVKIASPDLVNRPLLRAASQLGVPVLASTGAATLDEVAAAVAWLRDWRAEFALLHCVSAYPTPADDAHLRWISELSERFAAVIGYSDHTTELSAGALAVACGAAIVEKHLTYDRAATGPDHSASADPRQFAEYVRGIRLAEQMCGRHGKRVLSIERDVRTVSRQSLVLNRDLTDGEQIRETDMVVQRPGTGIPAAELAALVGRRVRQTVRAGTLLKWDMIADVA